MRIFKYKNRLVEETSRASGTVVFFQYLHDEDKEKCPHCGSPINVEKSIVEDCLNWVSDVKPVETTK